VRALRAVFTGILAASLAAPPGRADVGLGTQFTDAVIENLEPGGTYNLRELRGVPYSVTNIGDAEVEVEIEVEPPPTKLLQENYEPIPDPSWIRLLPAKHRIPAKGMAFSDIVIAVPADPALVGRHFQANIWVHTVGTGLLGTGLRSRVRFSVGPGPESLAKEKARKAMVDLNFEVWPSVLYVTDVPPGKRYDAGKKQGKSVTVTNRSNKPLELVLKVEKWNPHQQPLPEGHESGDPAWVQIKPVKLKIKPFTVQEVKVTLDVPPEQAGKKLAYFLQAALPIGTVVSASNRIQVTVQGENP
jgi:hypothetical protein